MEAVGELVDRSVTPSSGPPGNCSQAASRQASATWRRLSAPLLVPPHQRPRSRLDDRSGCPSGGREGPATGGADERHLVAVGQWARISLCSCDMFDAALSSCHVVIE